MIYRLLTGMIIPDKGEVRIGDNPLEVVGRKQARNLIGSVTQEKLFDINYNYSTFIFIVQNMGFIFNLRFFTSKALS